MYDFRLYLCCWSLLALLLEGSNITTPETVEVDLIFPRNDTYAPSPLLPLVIAIQNSHAAAALSLSFEYIIWNVTSNGSWDYPWWRGDIHLESANLSSRSDPYFAFDSTAALVDTEGPFMLAWTLNTFNCSGSPQSSDTLNLDNPSKGNLLYFSTAKDAQPAGRALADATDRDTCAQIPGFTYNVTGSLEVPDGLSYISACAILSLASSTPAPSPCQVHLSPASASSISTAVTSAACAWSPDPVLRCPATKTSEVAQTNHTPGSTQTNYAPGAIHYRTEETSWLVAIFGWLAYVLL